MCIIGTPDFMKNSELKKCAIYLRFYGIFCPSADIDIYNCMPNFRCKFHAILQLC